MSWKTVEVSMLEGVSWRLCLSRSVRKLPFTHPIYPTIDSGFSSYFLECGDEQLTTTVSDNSAALRETDGMGVSVGIRVECRVLAVNVGAKGRELGFASIEVSHCIPFKVKKLFSFLLYTCRTSLYFWWYIQINKRV